MKSLHLVDEKKGNFSEVADLKICLLYTSILLVLLILLLVVLLVVIFVIILFHFFTLLCLSCLLSASGAKI